MKVLLMHPDRDFDVEQNLPANEEALVQDLGLTTLFDAMALGDDFLRKVARTAVLSSLQDLDAIAYRQRVLRDCLEHRDTALAIYDVTVRTVAEERKIHLGLSRSPHLILHRSIELMELFVGMLEQLRQIADEHGDEFTSEGMTGLLGTLRKELDDDYFGQIEEHLKRLRFRNGVLLRAELGNGNKGVHHTLRRSRYPKPSWIKGLTSRNRVPSYTFYIHERDESGSRSLSELKDRGIDLVANALAQSCDHIRAFFSALRVELGFYVGCLNLDQELSRNGHPTCVPTPRGPGSSSLTFRGLYDAGLALNLKGTVVGNDADANNKQLVMVTGANQGGKSTFLRSVGVALLMMQCGLFVSAESFDASVCDGIFTHYKREEDATMTSGKLDEELGRMSDIADNVNANSVLLCNESLAATNEREGSEIAQQIVRALIESGVRVFFVTHMFDLAHRFYLQRSDRALFLRAERRPDGARTFRLVDGEPLSTSYGRDLYDRIFGAAPDGADPVS